MKFSTQFLFIAGAVLTAACGVKTIGPAPSANVSNNTSTVATPVNSVPVYQSGCATPLTVSVAFSPVQPTVGIPTQIMIQAQGCQGLYEFTAANSTQNFPTSGLSPWSGSASFSYVFPQSGAQTFSIQINAVNALGAILQRHVYTQPIDVLPSTVTSVNPPVLPAPPSAPTCQITRVTPIAALDAFAPVTMTVTGAPTTLTINGVAVQPGGVFMLPPTSAGSARYIALGAVSGPGGQGTCGLTFEVPIGRVEIIEATAAGIRYRITLSGPVTRVTIDGGQVTLPQLPTNTITGSVTRPTGKGKLVVSAENAATGDRTSTSGSYCATHLPFIAVSEGSISGTTGGYSTNSGTTVGLGYGPEFLTVTFNQPVAAGDTYRTEPSAGCDGRGVMIGRSSDNKTLCLPLATGPDGAIVELARPYTVDATTGGTSYPYRCRSGDVLTGASLYWDNPYLKCATPVWNECK